LIALPRLVATLFNRSCLGNREWSRSWQRKFHKLSDSLVRTGFTRFTVSTPFLLERLKSRYPQIWVKAGIFAQIDTPNRARFWEALGADELTLGSFSINRNFPRLDAIRRAVDCKLQLIANHICLPNCPMQPYHQNGFAHSSNGSRRFFLD
jgi:collagenase-like PrtC family protease